MLFRCQVDYIKIILGKFYRRRQSVPLTVAVDIFRDFPKLAVYLLLFIPIYAKISFVKTVLEGLCFLLLPVKNINTT